MVAATATVEVQGPLVSQPYVAMTLAVMEAFGVRAGNRKNRRFDVRPARYLWLGTSRRFDAFTFIFVETPGGVFQVHAYRFDESQSAWNLAEVYELGSTSHCSKLGPRVGPPLQANAGWRLALVAQYRPARRVSPQSRRTCRPATTTPRN